MTFLNCVHILGWHRTELEVPDVGSDTGPKFIHDLDKSLNDCDRAGGPVFVQGFPTVFSRERRGDSASFQSIGLRFMVVSPGKAASRPERDERSQRTLAKRTRDN